MAKRMGEMRSA